MSEELEIEGQNVPVKLIDDWALTLMRRGLIVKLSISMWRAQATIDHETLGLKFADDLTKDFTKKYISLGHQRLLPPKVVSEFYILEKRGRDALDRHSFKTIWGRFVPFMAFAEWQRENEAAKKDFIEAATVFGSKYEEIVKAVKYEYRSLAKDVWKRLYEDDSPTESFVEDFTQKIIDRIPPREELISSFKYDEVYSIIAMPSYIEDEIAKANQIKRDEEIAVIEDQLEKETKKKVAEIYVERKKELIDGFLEATVKQLREYVSDLCDTVLKSIGKQKRGKRLTVAHVKKIKDLIKRVNHLNFYNDNKVSQLLKELEFEVDKSVADRDMDNITDKLKQIVKVGADQFDLEDFDPVIDYLEV